MAENTRMKEVTSDIRDLKKVVELLEQRDNDFAALLDTRDQQTATRLDGIEAALEKLRLTLVHQGPHTPPPFSTVSTNISDPPPGPKPPYHVRNVKVDFPRFDGENVLQWLFKAEQFFEFYGTPDEHRLSIAALHFEKDVIPWFQMITRTQPFQNWKQFAKALELEFGPSPYDCPRSTLFKLSQSNSVSNYYTEFMSLANRVYGLSPDALLDCFISGLKPDLKREVIAQNPLSILKAVSLAKLFEEKYIPKPKSQPPYKPYTQTTPYTYPKLQNSQPPLLPTPTVKPFAQPTNPIKKMTPTEMQIRREKGLCYTCDERFSPNHRCPNKHYMILQVDEEQCTHEDNVIQTDSVDSLPQDATDHHLSFNALKGSSGVGTIKFQGRINGCPVNILLDSGSSDNFLQPRIAHFLKLPIEPAPNFQVMVGNGNSMSAEGFISDLQVEVQGYTLQFPVYLLPVAGADLVLGAAWLATLGPHVADYSALAFKFLLDGKFITLYGEKQNLPQLAQFHHIKRLHQTHAIAEVFSIQLQESDNKSEFCEEIPQNLEPALVLLLHTYKEVFTKPSSLPPQRFQDHSIPLIEGSNPVKVRPYRYAHSQKAQIEKMVADMLAEGIITPSKDMTLKRIQISWYRKNDQLAQFDDLN
ncbi:uncharacterized protein LOC109791920 [Cajanus cajan]|uniref:uncharacterized protein LOC109791920 n=1 Tax=Cajanus cajan TaxID=3821 RepID=UPI00098D9FDC|nr:uncharacterized protein LOC109791920 [Cajanus cajan]